MMTPAESTSDPAEGVDFEGFYRGAEPRIRRALVAACGPTAGYRVGRNAARSRRKPLPAVEPDVAERYNFEPGLPAALNRLSEHQRQAVLLVHAGGATMEGAYVSVRTCCRPLFVGAPNEGCLHIHSDMLTPSIRRTRRDGWHDLAAKEYR